MRLASLLVGCCAAVALTGPATAATAATAPSPPQLTSFAVTSVDFHGTGLHVAVAGSLDCTHHADFHLDLWVYQSGTGALAKASIPASRGAHPTKKRLASLRRASRCHGSEQSWSVTASAAPARSKHRTGFAAGPGEVCTVVDVGKSRRYILQTNCYPLTITKH